MNSDDSGSTSDVNGGGFMLKGSRVLEFEDAGLAAAALEFFVTSPPRQLGTLATYPPVLVEPSRVETCLHLGSEAAEGAEATVFLERSGSDILVSAEVIVVAEEARTAAAYSEKRTARALLRTLIGAASEAVAGFERAQTLLAFSSDGDTSDGDTSDGSAEDLMRSTRSVDQRRADLQLIVSCIDLTTLEGDDTAGRIRALCAQANQPDPLAASLGPTAAVCVYPKLVELACSLLTDSPVKVASVAGAFPSGLSELSVRLDDIRAAVSAGADEIDIVLDRAAFLDGRFDVVAAEVKEASKAAGQAHLKVILEVGDLGSAAAIAMASELAIGNGADWIKTSTGKTSKNATPAAVLTMAKAIAENFNRSGVRVGLKVAGGVRSADEALGYLAIVRSVLGTEWLTPELFRFGASSLLDSVVDALAELDPE